MIAKVALAVIGFVIGALIFIAAVMIGDVETKYPFLPILFGAAPFIGAYLFWKAAK